MKILNVIENGKDLVDCAPGRPRAEGEALSPVLPDEHRLVFHGVDGLEVELKAAGFKFCDSMSAEEIITALAKAVGINAENE